MDKYNAKLADFGTQHKTLMDNIEAENRKLNEINESNREKTELLKSFDVNLEAARERYHELDSILERCNSDIKLNNEKIANLHQNIQRLDSENAELKEKLDELDAEEAGKQDKLKYLEKQLETYSTKLSEYEAQMADLLKTLDENERHIELLKASIMDKIDIQSDKKMQINNVETHIENMHKRQKAIDS
jgi:chromosome segregation protein